MTTLLDPKPGVNLAMRPDAAISNDLPVSVTPSHPGTPANVHDSAVAEIVEMIRAKYTEEGKRSFDIGRRAFEHAQWQRGNFHEINSGAVEFSSADFNTLMKRIRDGVRMFIPIKPESIRVADWVRCHVLRELVRAEIADHAESLTMFEYLTIVGKALWFSSKDLQGDLNPGWLDMIRSVALDRARGVKVSRKDFEARIIATLKRIADSKSGLSPEELAAKTAAAATKAKKFAVAKANEDITEVLKDGLSEGHVTADEVLAILETVAKAHGIALPPAIGFDPAGCTETDCDLLASAMFQANKHAEMRRLYDRLGKMVLAVDKARETAHGMSARMALKTA